MEKDYINFLILVCVSAFFFAAGIRMKNNPERQIDRLMDIMVSEKTFDRRFLFNVVKERKKNKAEALESIPLIKREYLKNETH